ncbi:hypothetical protein DFH11DRAFT_1632114 [Phellopilus nigrolimitatus]|nr:hypothetical protein DFH11DRAFT_1632114 [Phellopilus nigrolimitatus]
MGNSTRSCASRAGMQKPSAHSRARYLPVGRHSSGRRCPSSSATLCVFVLEGFVLTSMREQYNGKASEDNVRSHVTGEGIKMLLERTGGVELTSHKTRRFETRVYAFCPSSFLAAHTPTILLFVLGDCQVSEGAKVPQRAKLCISQLLEVSPRLAQRTWYKF